MTNYEVQTVLDVQIATVLAHFMSDSLQKWPKRKVDMSYISKLKGFQGIRMRIE
jgi:hypothetical protein